MIARNKYALAALVALIQTAVLGYMIQGRASILRNGVEVVLATQPVDPRDLMRGDYVTLAYPISSLDKVVIQGATPGASGITPVYVALVLGAQGRHVISRASWQPLADLSPQETVLVGHTPDWYSSGADPVPLTYGIERYYVPEGEGRQIEQGVREASVDVVLAVAGGKAQIRSLRLDGKTLYDEPLY